MKTIVVVGDGDSVFIAEYLRWLRQHSDYRFWLVTWRNKKYSSLLASLGIKVVLVSDKRIRNSWKRAYQGYKDCKEALLGLDMIDVLHFQFLDLKMLIWSDFLFKRTRKSVMTFWGSDLFYSGFAEKLVMRRYLGKADTITLMTKEMDMKFHEIYGRKYEQKLLRYIDFGNSLYPRIEQSEREMTREQCKAYWNMPVDKVVIHIGYNAVKEQNHLAIITELLRLPRAVLDDIYVVLHFGYGLYDKSYKMGIERALREGRAKYAIIEKYMYAEEMAIFRRTADIWIHGRDTDAFSASMCEYMYAGALMLKGAWLRYSKLIEGKYYYYDFADFTKLAELLMQVLMPGGVSTRKILGNRIKLKKLNSWEVYGPKWIGLYDKLCFH